MAALTELRDDFSLIWILDSGSSSHMTNSTDMFDKEGLKPYEKQIFTANGNSLVSKGLQDVTIDIFNADSTLDLPNTMFVPALVGNVISISRLIENDYSLEFFEKYCKIVKRGRKPIIAERDRGHYVIKTSVKHQVSRINKNFVLHSESDHSVEDCNFPIDLHEPEDWPQMIMLPENHQRVWKLAMDCEMLTLREAEVWDVCDVPLSNPVIPCRWVFKIKYNEKMIPCRARARLVAKGYAQRPGVDFGITYAPVVKHTTIRTLLTIAGFKKFKSKHCDINSAFLYGEIEEDLFMSFPQGPWDMPPSNKCVKLRKAIYGLRQAAKAWNERIDKTLLDFGLCKAKSDECLYYRISKVDALLVIIHVDDILMFSNKNESMLEVVQYLDKEYQLKDLGEVSCYLGIQIDREKATSMYSIHQTIKIKQLIKDLNLDEGKGSDIPMVTDFVRARHEINSEPLQNNVRYQQVIGSLMYLSLVTRPDISISTNILGRSVSRPTVAHWEGCKRVVRYLKTTVDLKLHLNIQGDEAINVFCDADWGGDLVDRHSTSGGVYRMGNSVINWSSRKQKCISLSTAEAEYIALSEAVKEVIWLISLMKDLDRIPTYPIEVNCDSKSCISIAEGEGLNSRTKHIDIRNHFTREQIQNNTIALNFCPSELMLADTLTKPLGKEKFVEFRRLLQLS